MKKDNIFLISFKKTLGTVSAVIASILMLGLLAYGIFYFIHRPPSPLKPGKSVFPWSEKVNYGYETLQLLEVKKIKGAEDNTCHPISIWSESAKEAIKNNPSNYPDLIAVNINIKNSNQNKTGLYYSSTQQYSLIKKDLFDIKTREIKTGKENDAIRAIDWTDCNISPFFYAAGIDPGESRTGWMFFKTSDNPENFYLVANLFSGSPALVFNLE